jgi:3-methyladenine DNA glycosylase AlkD
VVGQYLVEQPRDILYRLARCRSPWERRTAIVGTYYLTRAEEARDTFRIAELLLDDENELVQKAVGSWLREAGKKDRGRLLQFVNKYAARMSPMTLGYATEKLDRSTRSTL